MGPELDEAFSAYEIICSFLEAYPNIYFKDQNRPMKIEIYTNKPCIDQKPSI